MCKPDLDECTSSKLLKSKYASVFACNNLLPVGNNSVKLPELSLLWCCILGTILYFCSLLLLVLFLGLEAGG